LKLRRTRRGRLSSESSDSGPTISYKVTESPAVKVVSPLYHWSNPASDNWDVVRVVTSDYCLAPDPLLKKPSRNFTYIDSNGRLKDPDKYNYMDKEIPQYHPKLAAHIRNGTDTSANRLYYKDFPANRCFPIAGIIPTTPDRRDSEVRDLSSSPDSSDSSEDSSDTFFPGLRKEQALTQAVAANQEASFLARPSVKLIIPDHIKAILVDDWENVTKNQQLVPLPAAYPVNKILDEYLEYEKPRRQPGSAEADILEEVIAGLKEYFEKCLGRILLYR
jgi:hypothetical protein